MIDAFRAAFQELIDASLAADPQRFGPAVAEAYNLARQVPAEERNIALEALAPIFAGNHAVPGMAADLMVVAGALVEMGASPGEAGIEVLRRLRETGKGAGVFLYAWDKTGGGAPPEPEQVTAADEERVAEVLGESAPTATMCWWVARRYGLSAKTMLSDAGVRAALREDAAMREELLAVAGQLAPFLPEFGEAAELLRMSEAASALVLDRASGRGFRVRFDGVGDNFQLHTLLADALVGAQGRGLAGERPDPAWVAAASDGEIDRDSVVTGWWNLVAADGSWVWNEGVPGDVPVVEGERVVVLDEPPYKRTWNSVRRHPHIAGRLEVVEELDGEQAALWWRRAAPGEAMGEAFGGAGSGAQPVGPVAQEPPLTQEPPSHEVAGPAPEAPGPQGSGAAGGPADPVPGEAFAPRPAPTEAIPAVTDAAAPDPVEAAPQPDPGPESADRRPPGADFLPPLPPGVSDSAAWGPNWR
ncbi:hypothetical protein HDA32_002517 [Spinactinospora alkalitolerans]|uniref:Uncharacterized protein n=1 Tax=Spinactinospora alkalitolerans TaxID=687207 RepID=A0A852TVS2_9ACTN|nr:hypothetical protein [Spinactinospora alkalitolerans]NYE47397.1 hypothetical protein [Spinactinospora alkalitolerans]